MAVSRHVAVENQRELGIGDDVLTVLPAGVETERFRPDPSARATIRASLGLSTSAPVVALATRLEREKGVHLALEAAARLRRSHPDLHVLIAGHGHDEPRLRSLAARLRLNGACTFLGLVEHDRLPALLAASDVFLLPSLCAEGRPLSVVEASAVGLPVVATSSPGTQEVVADGVTGLLVRRGDVDDLAAAVARLLNDATARTAMGERGRRAAVTEWSADAVVGAVETVLDQVVSRSARPR
jgi:phosphatidylinositol alpha-1,6-mannosyltransferase